MALGLVTSSLRSFIKNCLGQETPLTSMIVRKMTATDMSEKFLKLRFLIAYHFNHSQKTKDKYYAMKKKIDKAPLASAKIHAALRQSPIDLRCCQEGKIEKLLPYKMDRKSRLLCDIC